jgi:hypothetical protein
MSVNIKSRQSTETDRDLLDFFQLAFEFSDASTVGCTVSSLRERGEIKMSRLTRDNGIGKWVRRFTLQSSSKGHWIHFVAAVIFVINM